MLYNEEEYEIYRNHVLKKRNISDQKISRLTITSYCGYCLPEDGLFCEKLILAETHVWYEAEYLSADGSRYVRWRKQSDADTFRKSYGNMIEVFRRLQKQDPDPRNLVTDTPTLKIVVLYEDGTRGSYDCIQGLPCLKEFCTSLKAMIPQDKTMPQFLNQEYCFMG